MHNSKDSFSNDFFTMLSHNQDICDMLNNSFFLVGWDVENQKYYRSLCKALEDAQQDFLCSFIESGTCAAFLLQNVHGKIQLSSVFTKGIIKSEFISHLHNSQDFVSHSSREDSEEQGIIDSAAFQQIMADRLGDRDYDCYAFDQHDYLRKNIGFALFGPPQDPNEITWYDEKSNKKIEEIVKVVFKNNAQFTEYKDQVEMYTIFNCTEPLSKEKESRKKKNVEYNPETDILPVPIFVLRKCRKSINACRIFIDDIGRKYETWAAYIENNKLHKCKMVLPKDGRYQVDNDKVLLEIHDSPACSIGRTFLKAGDITSTVAGVGSGGVFLAAGAATITTIAVAPAALLAAGIVGAGAGVYSIGRAVGNLVDRVKHEETLSLANSEARGIYFNILAGSLGFVGAGANMAVSQLAARGVNIGQGVGAVVNTIGVVNIGVSGASVINSGYDVFDQWYNQNQNPSFLTMVQLSSSILFFGNAVYNFKTCQTIVDETQARVLQDYSDSLRSNRHRKTFDKMTKETIRQNSGDQIQGRAEVIKTIRNIPNKDDVFALLTRNNKLMNKKGVKFFAAEGNISLNGQSININELITMNKYEANAFLSNLPTKVSVLPSERATFIRDFSLNNWSLPSVDNFATYALKLVDVFGANIQGMLLQILKDLIPILTTASMEFLAELFPINDMAKNVLQYLMTYFGGKAADYLKNYEKWRQTGRYIYYDRDFSNLPKNKSDQYVWIFEKLVNLCFSHGHIKDNAFKEILDFIMKFVVNEFCEYTAQKEANAARDEHSPKRPEEVKCKICSGYYFKGVK